MTAKKKERFEPENALPLVPIWLSEQIICPFQSGIASVFLLHGDIGGLVANPDREDDPDEDKYITLPEFFQRIFSEREMVIFYDIANGLRFLTPEMKNIFRQKVGLDSAPTGSADAIAAAKAQLKAKQALPRDVESCLPLIDKVLKTMNNVAVIIQSAHFIAPTSSGVALPPNERVNIETLRNWIQSANIRKSKNVVLLLTDQSAKVSSELRQSGSELITVFIPKPNFQERLDFIQSIAVNAEQAEALFKRLREHESKLKGLGPASSKRATLESEVNEIQEALDELPIAIDLPKDFDSKSMAVATQGMNLRQIRDIFLESSKSGKAIDLDYVRRRKQDILNSEYGDVMEVVEPKRGLEDIGGMEHIKVYFSRVLSAIRQGESRLVPMGITLMGPPGTGKTALVEALAFEAKFTFVKTKSIRSMWVGESEARQEKLIWGLRALAPVVVMNDEADLNEANRDAPKGDSGVSERLMKMWMELLSDPKIRGQIIVINCTNRPDRIDAALKRSGRSDERLLLPMPSQAEREAIFQVMIKRHQIPTSLKEFSGFAQSTSDLSGADLENVVLRAYSFAAEKGKKVIDEECLQEAIRDFIPSASQEAIDRMTLYGLSECSSRRLLPPNAKEILIKIMQRRLVPEQDEIVALIKSRKIVEL